MTAVCVRSVTMIAKKQGSIIPVLEVMRLILQSVLLFAVTVKKLEMNVRMVTLTILMVAQVHVNLKKDGNQTVMVVSNLSAETGYEEDMRSVTMRIQCLETAVTVNVILSVVTDIKRKKKNVMVGLAVLTIVESYDVGMEELMEKRSVMMEMMLTMIIVTIVASLTVEMDLETCLKIVTMVTQTTMTNAQTTVSTDLQSAVTVKEKSTSFVMTQLEIAMAVNLTVQAL